MRQGVGWDIGRAEVLVEMCCWVGGYGLLGWVGCVVGWDRIWMGWVVGLGGIRQQLYTLNVVILKRKV